MAVFFIERLAPNVSKVTQIRTVDLHLTLPDNMLRILVKKVHDEASRLKDRYRRNGKKVDKEIREALVAKMKKDSEVGESSADLFKDLATLFRENLGNWKKISSPFKDVKMETKEIQQDEDNSIIIGRAEGTADCTAEEAAAWVFEYCSRTRTAESKGESLKRLELRTPEKQANEKYFADIKLMPAPFCHR